MIITASVDRDQARRLSRELATRLYPRRELWNLGFLFAYFAGAICVLDLTLNRLPGDLGWFFSGGSVLFYIAAVRALLRAVARRWEAKVRQERGIINPVRTEVEATAAGLALRTSDSDHRFEWPAVSELFKARGHWLLVVESNAYPVPVDAFGDASMERAFVAECLKYMEPPARNRSWEAQMFAAARD